MSKDLIKLFAIGLILFLGGFTLKSIGITESSAQASESDAREISYQVNDGLVLHAWLRLPSPDSSNSQKKPGLVILLPMLGKTHNSYDQFCTQLNDIGYASLSFDLRGHGSSTKVRGKVIEYADMTPEDFALIPQDIAYFFEKFKSESPREIDYSDVIIVGASIGANTAGLLLKEKWVAGVAMLSPGKNYRSLEPGLVMTSYPVDGEKGKPVYIAASKDDSYAASSSQWLFDNYQGTKLYKKYPGDNHGTDILANVKNADSELIDWLQAEF